MVLFIWINWIFLFFRCVCRVMNCRGAHKVSLSGGPRETGQPLFLSRSLSFSFLLSRAADRQQWYVLACSYLPVLVLIVMIWFIRNYDGAPRFSSHVCYVNYRCTCYTYERLVYAYTYCVHAFVSFCQGVHNRSGPSIRSGPSNDVYPNRNNVTSRVFIPVSYRYKKDKKIAARV